MASSLHLIHGPAHRNDRRIFLDQLSHWIHNKKNWTLVVPDQKGVEDLTEAILKLTDGILTGHQIITYDHFLFSLLKANRNRCHLANRRQSRLALRILCERAQKENRFPTLKNEMKLSGFIPRTTNHFIRLKREGFSVGNLRAQFKNPSGVLQDTLQLFEDYTQFLKDFYHVDSGDLITEVYELLETDAKQNGQNIIWPFGEAIGFTEFFPFKWSDLKILTLLKAKNIVHEILINYRFDHTQKDDLIYYPLFTELGLLADQTTADTPPTTINETTHTSFENPAVECEETIKKIITQINSGIAPHEIGVIVPPDKFYLERFVELADTHQLPIQSTQLSPSPQNGTKQLQQLVDDWRNETDILPAQKLRRHLQKEQILQNFYEEWQAECNLFGASQSVVKMQEDELKYLNTPLPKHKEGIALGSWADLSGRSFKKVFCLGWNDSVYPLLPAPFSPPLEEALQKGGLPAFIYPQKGAYRLFEMEFAHLQAHTDELILSSSRLFWDGKEGIPAMIGPAPVRYYSIDNTEENRVLKKETVPTLNALNTELKIKTKISVTQLESYLTCPYQFYAKNILNLKEWREESTDIPPDTKGQLVHSLFWQLYKNNTQLWHEALKSEAALTELQQNLIAILNQESPKYLSNPDFSKKLATHFLAHLTKILPEWLKKEISWVQQGYKKSTPALFEVAFGSAKQPGLRVTIQNHVFEITGRVDRIDLDDESKTFDIIDYKTGTVDSPNHLTNGKSLQIPLYLIMVSELLLKDYLPYRGILISLGNFEEHSELVITDTLIKNPDVRSHAIELKKWDEFKQEQLAYVTTALTGMAEGRYTPNPVAGACTRCAYRLICPKDQHAEEDDS